MNTKYISSWLVVFLFLNYSCKNELVPQDNPSSSTIENGTVPPVLTPGTNTDRLQNLPGTQQNTAMNPAHGEEGHRCDIAVGAPLNSVSNNTASPSSPAPTNSGTSSKTNSAITKSGMNPPHGEAGHRCDIAVGSPLNSPISKPATPAVTKNSSATSTVPAVLKPNAKSIVTKPGMNPPHGETGHRCDIAVGAPLDSPSKNNEATPKTPGTNNSEVPALLKLDSTTDPKS